MENWGKPKLKIEYKTNKSPFESRHGELHVNLESRVAHVFLPVGSSSSLFSLFFDRLLFMN